MRKSIIPFMFLMLLVFSVQASKPMKLGLLKYQGGGDWYSVVDALRNLANFCNKEMGTNLDPEYDIVEAGNPNIINYPFILMTGHGNVVFSNQEAENLRNYMAGGGFLYIDDDYGMNQFIRPALKKVFPDQELVEIPFNHPLYHQQYDFSSGVPKVHEHDNHSPQTFGIFLEGKLVCLYTYESNISDGWESADVHHDPEALRTKALQMGANMVRYAFSR